MPNETSTKKNLSATVYYLLTGIVLGWPGFLATGALLPNWQHGVSFTPISLAAIHMLVLGFMLTVAFGVLYQIVPIAFQTPPVPRHVLYWHLPLHIISVLTMVLGFLWSNFTMVGIGGSILLCNSIAYFALIGRRYLQARNKTAVHKGLFVPLTSLWLVMGVGVYQAFFPSHVTQQVILTHVLLGGFGFWGGLVLVFSYKLLPMFSISHGYRVSLMRSSSFFFGGTAVLIGSAWVGNPATQRILTDIAGLSILCSLLFYAMDFISIVRARKRRRLVLPMYDSIVATACLILGQTGILLAALFSAQKWIFPSIYLFGLGGLMGLIFSYMQKIVPFLWFEYRFSKRPERKTAPLIDDMVPKRLAQSGMLMYFLGVLIGLFNLIESDGTRAFVVVGWLSAACLTLGSMMLFGALRHVFTIGGARPPDGP